MNSKGLFILITFLLIFVYALFAQTKPDLTRVFELQKLGTPPKEVGEEIKRAYAVGDWEGVVKIIEKMGPFVKLSAEEFLMGAKAYLFSGNPEKALDFAERARTLRRGTSLFCEGGLIKAKAYMSLGKKDLALKELKALEESFCKEEFSEEIKLLKAYIEERFTEEVDPKRLKALLQEVLLTRFNFLIKNKKFSEAEALAFEYLNLTGDYRRGKDFFFKLAEAYFREGKVKEAKKYYQLIITEWDLTKEATISKFRLYQIAYERAPIKELLPSKTLDDLLMFIQQIKNKYRDDQVLLEEATFLESDVNFFRKNWERVRSLSKEFFKSFPESRFLPKVKEYYCKASTSLVPLYFLQGNLKTLSEMAEGERDSLYETGCGDFYYALGKEFFTYKAFGKSLDYLISAYFLKVSQENKQDLLLKLAYLCDFYQEKEAFELLFKTLEREEKSLQNVPLYAYLKGKALLNRDFEKAISFLKELKNQGTLNEALLKELYFQAFLKAITLKRYGKARELLKEPYLDEERPYLLLLSETFERDPKLFAELLKEAKTRFPKSKEVAFFEAYYLEKKGEIKKAEALFGNLTKSEGIFQEISKTQKRLEELMERAENLLY